MSTIMKFELGAAVLQFEAPAQYPAVRTYSVSQVRDRTAGNVVHTEELGVQIRTRVLNFDLMSDNDVNAIIDWYLNIVNGSKYTFSFTDEKGIVGEVFITNDILSFSEDSYENHSGQVVLEYV